MPDPQPTPFNKGRSIRFVARLLERAMRAPQQDGCRKLFGGGTCFSSSGGPGPRLSIEIVFLPRKRHNPVFRPKFKNAFVIIQVDGIHGLMDAIFTGDLSLAEDFLRKPEKYLDGLGTTSSSHSGAGIFRHPDWCVRRFAVMSTGYDEEREWAKG